MAKTELPKYKFCSNCTKELEYENTDDYCSTCRVKHLDKKNKQKTTLEKFI